MLARFLLYKRSPEIWVVFANEIYLQAAAQLVLSRTNQQICRLYPIVISPAPDAGFV